MHGQFVGDHQAHETEGGCDLSGTLHKGWIEVGDIVFQVVVGGWFHRDSQFLGGRQYSPVTGLILPFLIQYLIRDMSGAGDLRLARIFIRTSVGICSE